MTIVHNNENLGFNYEVLAVNQPLITNEVIRHRSTVSTTRYRLTITLQDTVVITT